jgi:Zn-dependent M28 family amino/carboxypeptidase
LVYIRRQYLESHVRVLAGDIGERNVFRPRSLASAADYISREWQAQGCQVVPHVYRAHGIPCANLEVTLSGRDNTNGIMLVGAHYDTVVGSPGADDNASGIASLLEISRKLLGSRLARTVRLVAFVNEEAPFFFWGNMGSLVYARAARARGDDIRLMISLEMLGYFSDEPGSQRYPPLFKFFYPDRGNFIAFVSNLRSRGALKRAAAAFRSVSDFPVEHAATLGWIPGVGWSDHSSFWRQGYPALMVTDTAFHRNPNYHMSSDTPDKIDFARLLRVTEGLCKTIAFLAGPSAS